MAGAAAGPTWRRRADGPTPTGFGGLLNGRLTWSPVRFTGGSGEGGPPPQRGRVVPSGGPPGGLRRDTAGAVWDDLLPDGAGRFHPAAQRARESAVPYLPRDRNLTVR